MFNPKAGGSYLRHGLGVAGGYMIATGQADPAQIEAIMGGIMAAISVVASLQEKNSRNK